MGIRRKIKDRVYHFWGIYNHLSSDAYISELEERGCRVGENTEFYGENNVDLGYAHLITIGKNCIITDRVRLLAHARDKPILDRRFKRAPKCNKRGTIDIGDNVFLGERTIVLPDVKIGDNVIVGAGSVVASDIPSESVAAGVPCEVRLSLEEYNEKRQFTEESEIRDVIERCRSRGVAVPEELTRSS